MKNVAIFVFVKFLHNVAAATKGWDDIRNFPGFQCIWLKNWFKWNLKMPTVQKIYACEGQKHLFVLSSHGPLKTHAPKLCWIYQTPYHIHGKSIGWLMSRESLVNLPTLSSLVEQNNVLHINILITTDLPEFIAWFWSF